ncbi:uncharacterized oxidoreductase TM_0325-like isoform X1 [Cydia amplana]|uniref:uncharacterized oxidoreductase TM_0325-like isoform X1 n=1 Tax=Cydia amplana TaxID=1869771 RepID=UPI002FE5F331
MFAKEGADVALVARTQAKLAAVAKNIEALGRKALVIQADLSKEADTATVVPKTVEHFGKLDVLVNNAGISPAGSLTEGTVLQAYDEVMKTNVRAVIQLTSFAAPYLAKTKGNVVNISSVVALRPCKNPELLPYFVSKAALDHFARCAAVELASSGVRVNTVKPGPVDNDFNSNNSLGDPKVIRQTLIDATLQGFIATNEEIGGVILFLASDKARSITGCNYVMDNGWTMVSHE